jgi:hypothetical protein
MPSTVNCNKLTTVHASSTGVAMSFPDVCKTPTPAGPIPIPYPNVAMSSDTDKGSKTVKVDKNPIMLKSSNFRMSTGDEAGSAMGVASNKIKGKAMPINTSFDVKIDGKNVFRLGDPMQTNSGSPSNSGNVAVAQPPMPEGTFLSDECKKIKKKRKLQKESVTVKNSGMHPPHFNKIKAVSKEFQMVFYIRQTNPVCIPWIKAKHQPKPHRVFKANTIKPSMVSEVDAWLEAYEQKLRYQGVSEIVIKAKINPAANPKSTNKAYNTIGATYLGVVGEPDGDGMRKPLRAVGTGPQLSGRSYAGKWITADYDLFQVLHAHEGCDEVGQKSRAFSRVKKAINKKCDWDAIQHGPQAQWVPTEHEKEKHGAPDVNFPSALKGALQSGNAHQKIEIPGRNPMSVVDKDVTVIAPGGSVYLKEPEDTYDALKCRECDK